MQSLLLWSQNDFGGRRRHGSDPALKVWTEIHEQQVTNDQKTANLNNTLKKDSYALKSRWWFSLLVVMRLAYLGSVFSIVRTTYIKQVVPWCSGYHVCFTRRRSWVRAPVEPSVFHVTVVEIWVLSTTSWLLQDRSVSWWTGFNQPCTRSVSVTLILCRELYEKRCVL